MTQQRPVAIPPWMLFAFPAALAIPIVAGVLLGGPVLGFLAAGLVAAVIVVVAIRMDPRRRGPTAPETPIEPRQTDAHGWRGAAARRFLVPLAIAAAGIVLIAATTGTARVIG